MLIFHQNLISEGSKYEIAGSSYKGSTSAPSGGFPNLVMWISGVVVKNRKAKSRDLLSPTGSSPIGFFYGGRFLEEKFFRSAGTQQRLIYKPRKQNRLNR
jgi:hypothetical protein